MAIQFSNLASTTLASGVSSSATSVSVTSASLFPSLGGSDYFYATLGDGTGSEIVKVTAISGTTFTVVRAQDGTSAISHNAGTHFALRVTAAALEDLRDSPNVESVSKSGDTMTGNLSLGDNVKLQLGNQTDGDLQIYHDGNNSRVEDTGTGGLRLIGSNFVSLQSTSGENKIVATSNGAVTLYHDNSPKIATTSSGINITGSVVADGLTVDGNGALTSAYLGGTGSLGSITTNKKILLKIDGGFSTNNSAQNKVMGFIGTTNSENDIFSSTYQSGEFLKNFYIGLTTDNSYFNANRLSIVQGGAERFRMSQGGDISFYNGSGNQGLFWDSSTSRLGLGVTNPDVKLHISGTSGDAIMRLERNDNTITTNDVYGEIQFEGQDASAGSSAGIRGKIVGVAEDTTGAMGLSFETAGGYGSSTERLRIKGDGSSVFSGSVTATGTLTTGNITVNGAPTGSEGGEILLKGTSSTEDIHIDSFDGTFRVFDQTTPQVRLSLDTSGNASFSGAVSISGTSSLSTEFKIGNLTWNQNSSSTSGLLHQYRGSDGYSELQINNTSTSGAVALNIRNASTSVATINNDGSSVFSGSVSAEDNIYLTDGGTVRAKLLLNSSDRDNVELRAESLGSTMKLFTVSTEALAIDASQNVNIPNGSLMVGATTTPAHPLEVAGATSTSIAYQRTGVSAKKWGFHTDNDNTYWQNITDNVLALTIKNNGNVGIGTATPTTAKLDVAGTALVENAKLKAIAESKSVTAVDVFVYDTSKDSDGGAWRKRTQNTSWYNEALNTSTRGSRKEFPAVAVIVAENTKVTIYDGDDPDMPMWMQFDVGGSNASMTMLNRGSNDLASVEVLNGVMGVGALNQNNHSGGVRKINFIADYCYIHDDNSTYTGFHKGGGIANRNSQVGNIPNASGLIVGRNVNDVAMTVLPNAPIDADTGLPVPTIAVATDGGVSVIKDDGSVVDITWSAEGKVGTVTFDADNNILISVGAGAGSYQYSYRVYAIPQSDISEAQGYQSSNNDLFDATPTDFSVGSYSGTVKYLGTTVNSIKITPNHIGSSHSGLTCLDRKNPSVAYITADYNTGWMNGDIKLATLSDTDTTNANPSELITNGDFSNGTTGWTAQLGANLSVSSGQLTVVSTGGNSLAYQYFTADLAKSYILKVTVVSGTGGLVTGGFSSGTLSAGTYTINMNAGRANNKLDITPPTNGTIVVDNISVKLAEQDRSVNGKGLQVFGTVTKTAVATGADLVGYKPSSSNSSHYLCMNQTDWSIGTGDFSIGFWWYGTSTGDTAQIYLGIPSTGGASPSSGFNIWTYGGKQKMYISGDYYDYTDGGMNKWLLKTIVRRNGVLSLYENGVLQAGEGGASTGSINDQKFNVFYGHYGQTNPAGSMALLRISATAPTAEQIAKIYNDEKHLFQENAKATLYGTSDAVTALAYDDDTELLHAGTSAGRSVFQGLRRVENTTDAVGSAISASNGLVAED